MKQSAPHIFSSKYNGRIELIHKNSTYSLIVDGLIQSGNEMEIIWEETIQVLLPKTDVKNVLVLGFGTGSIVPPLKKAFPKTLITGVEIDKVIINIAHDYFPKNLEGVQIKIGDAVTFIHELAKKCKTPNSQVFDVVVVDCYLGNKSPDEVSTLKFLISLKKIARIVIINQLFLLDNPEEIKKISFLKQLDKYYPVKILKLPYNMILQY